jgi:hypothetical protein
MNSKIVIAFIAGAVIASGVVYMAVREDAQPRAAAVPADVPVPAAPKTPPAALPASQTATTAPAPPAPVVLKPTHREKPSPMPPPMRKDVRQDVRHERPLIVARNQEPPPPRVPPPPIEAQIPNEPAQPPPAPVPAAPEPQAPPEAVAPSQPTLPPVRVPATVTIAAGTMLPVRIGETISTVRYQVGDSFLATLDRPLVVDGWVIAEKGSRLEGRVVEAASGRLRVELVKLSTSDGQHIQIRTDPYKKDAGSSTGADAAKVGAGAAIGAAIGAAAGGGKGAAIGVGAGAAAGVAGAALTHGRPAEIPVETRISFRVAGPVTITERLN